MAALVSRGSFRVEISGMRNDHDPASVALRHQKISVTGAVGPVGAVAGASAGHGPKIVNGDEIGAEIADRFHFVGAMRVFVKVGEELGMVLLDSLATTGDFAAPAYPANIVGKRSAHGAGIVAIPAVAEPLDNLFNGSVFRSVRGGGA